MNRLISRAIVFVFLSFAGCSGIYYGAMEKLGYQKRDLLISRVESVQSEQKVTEEEFRSALERFREIVSFDGGVLQEKYDKLSAVKDRCETRANALHNRIRSVEDVSSAMFKEWERELTQYSNQNLRRSSEEKLQRTRANYKRLEAAFHRVESKIEPVLKVLRDQVLYLKHNLNAQAIASLDQELVTTEQDVERLVAEIKTSIREADEFIRSLN